ncbi:AAA family ATPase [uncultured Maribacter sp.]|uniref:AAA family ATPase n=1 Tax=uncultured Maribacter sp. TaxID=431308 RepID=UPI002603DA33|nr:AAA family ATPase [uncultured Maribacter sp.]
MELKYVWIKKYKNLENIDFNFQHPSDDFFEYNDGFLNIKESKVQSKKGFFGINIKGLTTIVGKNGSGKTNLSEFLTYNLAHVGNGLSTYMKGEGIIVLKDKIFVQEDINIENTATLNKEGYDIIKYKNAPLDKSSGMDWHLMEKNKFIYYCPLNSYRLGYSGRGLDNMINISSSYLIRYDVYDTLKSVLNDDIYSWQKKNSTDSLSAHFRNEKLRESDLILNYEPIKKLIEVPKLMRISVDHPTENNLLNGRNSRKEDKKTLQIGKNFQELYQMDVGFGYYSLESFKLDVKTRTGYEKFDIKADDRKNAFKWNFLIQFFKGLLFFGDKTFPDDFLFNFIYDHEYDLEDKALLSDLEKLKAQTKELVNLNNWEDVTAEIIEGNLFSDDKRELQIYNLYSNFEIDIEQKNVKELLINLISSVKSFLNNQLNFHYEFFHQLSAGEQNLLNFYSRFYYAKNEVLKIEKDYTEEVDERIVIFIDEGEVGYHPEWQRLYFNQVVKYLTDLFENREIQLLLTTHSPFVLSDIPKENVIFLNKDKKGNAVKEEFEMEKTFGANIYSLLADSFFMENGTIGEFAKKKIKWVVEILDANDAQLSSEVLKEVNYIIDSVGEPLIKQQLEILRNNILNEDKVSTLERQVRELKNEIRKRDDNDKDQ